MDTSAVRTQEREVDFCLLGASFGTDNMGVSALASGTLSSLFHCYPEGRACLLDYHRQPARFTVKHAGDTKDVELANLRFSWRVLLPNNIARLLLTALFLRLLPSKVFRQTIIDRNSCLKAIDRADLIGSIAGGDSFSDIYGFNRLLYVSLPQVLVLLLGKPLVLLPQTLGPFKGRGAKIIARSILRRAQAVYARDRESLDEIRPLLGARSSHLRFSHDMAFALEPVAPSGGKLAGLRKLGALGPMVGLNVSGLLYMGGYNRRNMFGLRADYRETIRNVIQYFVQRNVHVLLVPHVFGKNSGSESDVTAGKQIHGEMAAGCQDRLHLLEGEYDHHEIKYAIGQCDFFLGSRMHACIAALSQGIPAVGLAYSRKFAGVFRSIAIPDLVIDLETCDGTEVIQKVRAIYELRDEIRQRLGTTVPDAKAAALNLLSKVVPKSRGGSLSVRRPVRVASGHN
jgi:polysaccharide pyruvyl transferase WcaK-like protein